MKSFLHTLHHLFLGTAVVLYTALAFAAAIGLLTKHFLVPTPQPYSDWFAAANAVLFFVGAIGAYGFWLLCCDLEAADNVVAHELAEIERIAEDQEFHQFAYDAFGTEALAPQPDDYADLYGPEIITLLAERYPARYVKPTQSEVDERYADLLIARQKEQQFPNY